MYDVYVFTYNYDNSNLLEDEMIEVQNNNNLTNLKLELEYTQLEFANYKEAIAEILNEYETVASVEDTFEKIEENIEQIRIKKFLEGISTKFIKVSESMSSRYDQSININNIENYQELSVDDFIIVNISMENVFGSDAQDIKVMTKQYNNQDGILTIGKQKSYAEARK